MPPLITVGSRCAASSTAAIRLVVVVLPCVPPIAIDHLSRISSASISARRTTGIRCWRAATTSGLSRFTAVETTTTYDKIYGIYRAKKEAIEEGFKEFGARYIAHFSHWFPWGVMIYDRFIIPKPPPDPREALELHTMIWAKAARTSLAHGGVLNDHPGIGFKLGWLMPEQYGPAFAVLQAIKDALDPQGIMNPGKFGFARRV